MEVLCDTSFLMFIVSKPIKQLDKMEGQLGKLDFLVPDVVICELRRLAEKAGPKRSMLAKTALEVVKVKNNFKVIAVSKGQHVDESIMDFASRNKCAAATMDTALRRRLIANEVIVLTLSKDRLIVANPRLNP